MATQDGGKIVSPLPGWIRAELPTSSFTLNSTEPFYFLVKLTTHLAPIGTYYLAVDESIAEKHFTGYVKVDVNPPVYSSPALPDRVGTHSEDWSSSYGGLGSLFPIVIGIGAALAGLVAFMTIRKGRR